MASMCLPGVSGAHAAWDAFAGLDLSIGDSHVVTVHVQILEVRNLQPRSGWQQELSHVLGTSSGNEGQRSKDLPCPTVQVFCGDRGYEVRWLIGLLIELVDSVQHVCQWLIWYV